jgi:hypothetical protein
MVRHLRSIISNAARWRGGGGDEDVFGVMSSLLDGKVSKAWAPGPWPIFCGGQTPSHKR